MVQTYKSLCNTFYYLARFVSSLETVCCQSCADRGPATLKWSHKRWSAPPNCKINLRVLQASCIFMPVSQVFRINRRINYLLFMIPVCMTLFRHCRFVAGFLLALRSPFVLPSFPTTQLSHKKCQDAEPFLQLYTQSSHLWSLTRCFTVFVKCPCSLKSS